MQANVVLVVWDGGMRQVPQTPTPPISEVLLEVGGVLTRAEAQLLGERYLAVVNQPKVTHVIAGLPLGEGGPEVVPFTVGDTILGDQVKSMTWTEDQNGIVECTPELRSKLDIEQARVDRILARYASGNADGSNITRPATPGNPAGTGGRIYELPPWSLSGPLSAMVGKRSPLYTPARPINLTHILATLGTPGSTSSTIEFYVNDDVGGWITFAPGQKALGQEMSTTLVLSTDTFSWSVSAAGTDAENATLQVRAVIA